MIRLGTPVGPRSLGQDRAESSEVWPVWVLILALPLTSLGKSLNLSKSWFLHVQKTSLNLSLSFFMYKKENHNQFHVLIVKIK